LRILHVVPSYIPAYRYGGPIRSVHGLCKGLVKLGHDIHVFTTNVDGPSDSDVPLRTPVNIDGVKVWYFPSKWLRRLYWSPPMAKALAEHVSKFDLLHLHSIFLWPTWAAARAARSANIPYVIAPRGMLVKALIRRKSRFLKRVWIHLIERSNLEHASGMHMTSQREVAEASKFGFRLPPQFIVPNGIDIEDTSGVAGRPSPAVNDLLLSRPFMLFLGRVNWEKGLDRLISALSIVPDIHVVIAGNDEEDYQPLLETLADRCGVRDRLHFTGPVHGTDKNALLKHATMLVLPSYSENFGIVVLEAMAAGCPVVVTPEVGAAELVKDAGAGMVLNGNPKGLGKGINELLLNSQLLKEMGERGKKAVRENFTWDVIARQMENVYREIINRK
jgi:glycosyltransferase involved in cell wall biosynthesis